MSEVDIYTALGYVSTITGILQMIPTLTLMYRLGHVSETSLLALALRWIGLICSSIYIQGVINGGGFVLATPMIISNTAAWMGLLTVTYFKLVLFKGVEVKPSGPEY